MRLSNVIEVSKVKSIVQRFRNNVEAIVNKKVTRCIEELKQKELEKDSSYNRMKEESEKSVDTLKKLTDK